MGKSNGSQILKPEVRFRNLRVFLTPFLEIIGEKEGQALRACPLFLMAFRILIPRLIP